MLSLGFTLQLPLELGQSISTTWFDKDDNHVLHYLGQLLIKKVASVIQIMDFTRQSRSQ
jgi:hypothetical protein